MCDGGVGLGFTGPLVLSGSLLLSWPTEANVCSPKTARFIKPALRPSDLVKN